MTQILQIPVGLISPDPAQPRKTFDAQKMQELATSIKENGVLQPIMLRPHPLGEAHGYVVVYGDRRHRAAKLAGMETIPAEVRKLTQAEITELQIVENGQRSGVHPMEEASSFLELSQTRTYAEIAAKTGMSEYYVKRRIKLNDLVIVWQKSFLDNAITLEQAVRIARLEADAQEALFENAHNKRTNTINLYNFDNTVEQVTGDLVTAIFDLHDITLNRVMGSCIGCRFNSETELLFPSDQEHATCSNKKCFFTKTTAHFERELYKVKSDPTVIFLNTGYQSTDVVKELKAEGFDVVGCNDFDQKTPPKKPSYEWFLRYCDNYGFRKTEDDTELAIAVKDFINYDSDQDDDQFDEDEDDQQEDQQATKPEITEQDYQEEYARRLILWENSVTEYRDNIWKEKYTRGFIVAGAGMGKFIYVSLYTTQSKEGRKAVETGEASEEQLKAEIERLSDREKRAQELDGEKVHVEVKRVLASDGASDLHKATTPLLMKEMAAAVLAMHDAGQTGFREFLKDVYGVDRWKANVEDFTKVLGLSQEDFNQILRRFLHHQLTPETLAPFVSAKSKAIHEVAKIYYPGEVKNALAAQEQKAEKRKARLQERINALEKQIATLTAQETPAKKSKLKVA